MHCLLYISIIVVVVVAVIGLALYSRLNSFQNQLVRFLTIFFVHVSFPAFLWPRDVYKHYENTHIHIQYWQFTKNGRIVLRHCDHFVVVAVDTGYESPATAHLYNSIVPTFCFLLKTQHFTSYCFSCAYALCLNSRPLLVCVYIFKRYLCLVIFVCIPNSEQYGIDSWPDYLWSVR